MLLSSNAELPLLHYLWKFRVATTSNLARLFYQDRTQRAAYERLHKLSKHQIIVPRSNTLGGKWVWILGPVGYEKLIHHLNPLRTPGYGTKSLDHDLLVSALQIGELLPTQKKISLVTEQQLRRYEFEALAQGFEKVPGAREYLPNEEKLSWEKDRRNSRYAHDLPERNHPFIGNHYPDGYWLVSGDSRDFTYALEVELNRQRTQDYLRLADFYKNKGITGVIWLVATQVIANNIHKAMGCMGQDLAQKHHFILLRDFIKTGWRTPFLNDHTLNLISFFQSKAGIEIPYTKAQLSFLDVRKCPHSSITPVLYELGDRWGGS